ncbi:50S ribosomal protein L25/general stress protein Ctc [Isoalcanivorax beigongshangi]|uniref:Large ribosomal subunit protein bL25 n=1 Tax=Isoalcanivorax beigongshangi TaxID=3238810 RepID=A0ABV4AIW1_9GAMM
MSKAFVLAAKPRQDVGKGASRRLRREQSLVPAIVYGGEAQPEQVTVELRLLVKALESDSFFSQVFTLDVDGKRQAVLLRDLQRHPAKGFPTHADFQRVNANEKVTVLVQILFENEDKCVGVKQQGGQIARNLSEVEISALPGDLPESLVVDLTDVEVGQIVHLSNLVLPEGVEIPALAQGPDHDQPIVSVNAARGGASADEDGEEEAGEA